MCLSQRAGKRWNTIWEIRPYKFTVQITLRVQMAIGGKLTFVTRRKSLLINSRSRVYGSPAAQVTQQSHRGERLSSYNEPMVLLITDSGSGSERTRSDQVGEPPAGRAPHRSGRIGPGRFLGAHPRRGEGGQRRPAGRARARTILMVLSPGTGTRYLLG